MTKKQLDNKFSEEELQEFKGEAGELLDKLEDLFLALETGTADFTKTYESIQRTFHNLKGGADSFDLPMLQDHMHKLESQFIRCKELKSLSKETISYFLKAIDISRQILAQAKISFDYEMPESKKEPVASNLPRDTVFIIDDEIDIVDTLSDMVREAGFRPLGFTSPPKALEKIKDEKPLAVLTDYKMPAFSGFDVLKAVLKHDPVMPVIFISGYMTTDMIIESLSMGAYGAIEKPFVATNVIAMVTQATQKYQLIKLLNSTMNLLYYQYPDIDKYLKDQGEELIRDMMRSHLKDLIEQKRKLKFL